MKQVEVVQQQMQKSKKNVTERSSNCSVTIHLSPENPILQEKLKITTTEILILPHKKFPE